VLEVWLTWTLMNGLNDAHFTRSALSFVTALSTSLRALPKRPRQLILAVPPPVPQAPSRPFITQEHLTTFSPHVDFWRVYQKQ
jgi:hypothetical protein